MLHELKQIRNTPREWRRFGWLMVLLLAGVGLWLAWRGRPAWPWWLGAGLALAPLILAAPKALRWPYLAWMSLGLVLGTVVSSLLLTVFFLLILTPLGLLARLSGRDFLERKLDPAAASYWQPRKNPAPKPPADYERQF